MIDTPICPCGSRTKVSGGGHADWRRASLTCQGCGLKMPCRNVFRNHSLAREDVIKRWKKTVKE